MVVIGVQLVEFSRYALNCMKSSIMGWSDLAHQEPGFSWNPPSNIGQLAKPTLSLS